MPEYKVFSRKYRPQTFRDVLGQDAIVTTLKNAIRKQSIAHAYLFCGARGTGKTTLARVLAKALNCQHPTAEGEPCNQCSSCKEIGSGHALDVLEIDGASHRGIDDIRQINENVGYTPAYGKYKIYIIDEVHMLTKEAFNALLKTLEEPPPKVLFFFATTEAHKVLPTIVSRCQRFNLRRLPVPLIMNKLKKIATDLHLNVEENALRLLANHAEGGMRDAESLFDQIVSFHEGAITEDSVAAVLGLMPQTAFFQLDLAGKEGRLSFAFDLAHQLFIEGKDAGFFLESLIDHFRTLLLVKLKGTDAAHLSISDHEQQLYQASTEIYTQEQCLIILDFLLEAQRSKATTSFGKIALEGLLLRILRIHQRVSTDLLIRRLSEMEKKINKTETITAPSAQLKITPTQIATQVPFSTPPPVAPKPILVTEDPTPTPKDLGIKGALPSVEEKRTVPVEIGARPTEEARQITRQEQSRLDTLLQFAAIELDGTLKRKVFPRS